jgi:hypothetical protein
LEHMFASVGLGSDGTRVLHEILHTWTGLEAPTPTKYLQIRPFFIATTIRRASSGRARSRCR